MANTPPQNPSPVVRPDFAPGTPSEKLSTCPKCSRWIDPSQALYNDQGELVCNACSATETISKGYLRAAQGAAHSALGMGVLSIFCDPFFIFSIVAVISAISAIVMMSKQEYIEQLGSRRTWLMIESVVGLIGGLVQPTFVLLPLLGLMLPR